MEKINMDYKRRVKLECRKVVGFALATLHDWFKNLARILIQSEVKTIVTPHLSSRASCHLHAINSSFSMTSVTGKRHLLWLWFYYTKKTALSTSLYFINWEREIQGKKRAFCGHPIACVAGVRRGRKEERRAHEAREDRTREDRGRGRLQGRYCFLYSAL